MTAPPATPRPLAVGDTVEHGDGRTGKVTDIWTRWDQLSATITHSQCRHGHPTYVQVRIKKIALDGRPRRTGWSRVAS